MASRKDKRKAKDAIRMPESAAAKKEKGISDGK